MTQSLLDSYRASGTHAGPYASHSLIANLKALLRETFGMPVHQYVIRQRTDRARSLLLQGKLSLSQIALESGFAHQSHMAHWMKRILGAAPGEIVREHAMSRIQGSA